MARIFKGVPLYAALEHDKFLTRLRLSCIFIHSFPFSSLAQVKIPGRGMFCSGARSRRECKCSRLKSGAACALPYVIRR